MQPEWLGRAIHRQWSKFGRTIIYVVFGNQVNMAFSRKKVFYLTNSIKVAVSLSFVCLFSTGKKNYEQVILYSALYGVLKLSLIRTYFTDIYDINKVLHVYYPYEIYRQALTEKHLLSTSEHKSSYPRPSCNLHQNHVLRSDMNLPVCTAYYSQKRRHLTRKLSGRIKTCLKKRMYRQYCKEINFRVSRSSNLWKLAEVLKSFRIYSIRDNSW